MAAENRMLSRSSYRKWEDELAESTAFKHYFGAELAADLGKRIGAVYPAFPQQAFVAQVAPQLGPLELKARVAVIAAGLRDHLPPHYPAAVAILLKTLGTPLAEQEGMFNDGWWVMPIATFVEHYGLDHPAESLEAIHAITQRHTGEFAIRPFIQRHPERTLAALRRWAHDPSFHVRRLVSEGTRPRLPWATRLSAFIADPSPVLGLLEALRDDPSDYVRRSVANHLNDISKDHPGLVLATLQRWAAAPTPASDAITRHALRGLVKAGHPEALALLGAHKAEVALTALTIAPATPRIGESARLSATIRSTGAAPQRLVIDYILHYAGARGTTSRRRVFKLRTIDLDPGAQIDLSWRVSLQPRTIRAIYPGPHRAELQVNGAVVGGVGFVVEA